MKKKIQKLFLWGLIGLASTMLVGGTSLIALNQNPNNDVANLSKNQSYRPASLTNDANEVKSLGDYLDFSPEKDGYAVKGFKDTTIPTNLNELIVPSTHQGKPVTKIADSAFASDSYDGDGEHIVKSTKLETVKQIKKVVIPESVKTIGKGAFYSGWIDELTLNNGLTNIEDYAFYYCNHLKNVLFPSTLTTLGRFAFCQCWNITSIGIPKSLTNFSQQCFCLTSCERLVFLNPDANYRIRYGAFGWIYKLKEIVMIGKSIVPPENYWILGYSSDLKVYINSQLHAGISYDETKNPNGLSEDVLSVLDGKEDLYTRKTNGSNVTELVGLSSTGVTKKSLVLPENITKIGDFAFNSCSESLNQIDIKTTSSNLDFGEYAFYNVPKNTKFVVHSDDVKRVLLNHSISDKQIYMPSALSMGAIAAITVSVILVALGGLGTGMIFLMRKQHKINILNSKLTNRRIDKLAESNAMAFKKVIEATGMLNKKVDQIATRQLLGQTATRRSAAAPTTRYQPTNQPKQPTKSSSTWKPQ